MKTYKVAVVYYVFFFNVVDEVLHYSIITIPVFRKQNVNNL